VVDGYHHGKFAKRVCRLAIVVVLMIGAKWANIDRRGDFHDERMDAYVVRTLLAKQLQQGGLKDESSKTRQASHVSQKYQPSTRQPFRPANCVQLTDTKMSFSFIMSLFFPSAEKNWHNPDKIPICDCRQ
jgi:hypothetical protein